MVGRIHCRRGGTEIEPEPVGLEQPATARQETMLQKLEHLVGTGGGDAFSQQIVVEDGGRITARNRADTTGALLQVAIPVCL